MRVRIIAGEYGGRMLDAPRGRKTHPMGERIRGALFNSIQRDVPGAEVLDAYAGTGAVGIEALSRGADHVTFIESGRIAQKVIARNLEMLYVDEERAKLVRSRVNAWISTNPEAQFDLIFADPPYYNFEQHFSTIERLFTLLKPGGLMVLSKPGKCEEIVAGHEIVVVDNRSYSNATLTFYRRKA
jgi:16S rRNA (guanine966-N2)-methyltransferase